MKEDAYYKGDKYYVYYNEKNVIGKITNEKYERIEEGSEEYNCVSVQFNVLHALINQ